ncbi:hypothetical protein D3C80_1974230 [compost metagenome]
MHDNLVALGKEGLGGGMAQSIGRAGNEYAGFAACIVVPLCVGRGSLPSGIGWGLCPGCRCFQK